MDVLVEGALATPSADVEPLPSARPYQIWPNNQSATSPKGAAQYILYKLTVLRLPRITYTDALVSRRPGPPRNVGMNDKITDPYDEHVRR